MTARVLSPAEWAALLPSLAAASGVAGTVELRLPDLVLIALMAAALIWGWHTWRR